MFEIGFACQASVAVSEENVGFSSMPKGPEAHHSLLGVAFLPHVSTSLYREFFVRKVCLRLPFGFVMLRLLARKTRSRPQVRSCPMQPTVGLSQSKVAQRRIEYEPHYGQSKK